MSLSSTRSSVGPPPACPAAACAAAGRDVPADPDADAGCHPAEAGSAGRLLIELPWPGIALLSQPAATAAQAASVAPRCRRRDGSGCHSTVAASDRLRGAAGRGWRSYRSGDAGFGLRARRGFGASIFSACRCCGRSPRGARAAACVAVLRLVGVFSAEASRAGRSAVFSGAVGS